MSIKSAAVKLGTKNAASLLRRLVEPIRVWATKRAWKRQIKRDALSLVGLIAVAILSGCATIDKGLIQYDNMTGGALNPYLNQLPQGYEARPYVIDAGANRIDVDGWQVKWEIVPSSTFRETYLPDAIAKPRKQSSAINDVVDAIREQRTEQPASATGVQAAIDIIEAAK